MKQRNNHYAIVALLGIGTVFLGIVFFWWTFVPYMQMRHYDRAIKSSNSIQLFDSQQSLFWPYTYAQPDIRDSALNHVLAAYTRGQVTSEAVLAAAGRLKEVTDREPGYPRYFYTLARTYTALAAKDSVRKTEYLGLAEEYCRRAYNLIPASPEIAHVYSLVLLNQGKYDEAISILTASLARASVPETHFSLGLVLFRMGSGYYSESLDQFEVSEFKQDADLALAIYKKFLTYFSATGDTAQVRTVIERLHILDPNTKYAL